jgi:hypothetical protein
MLQKSIYRNRNVNNTVTNAINDRVREEEDEATI